MFFNIVVCKGSPALTHTHTHTHTTCAQRVLHLRKHLSSGTTELLFRGDEVGQILKDGDQVEVVCENGGAR